MALHDKKKVQTMINVTAEQITIIRSAMSTIQTVKDIFQTVNPDITGTPLEGNLSTLNTAITDLQAEADKAVWTAMIDAYVPTHRGKAL